MQFCVSCPRGSLLLRSRLIRPMIDEEVATAHVRPWSSGADGHEFSGPRSVPDEKISETVSIGSIRPMRE